MSNMLINSIVIPTLAINLLSDIFPLSSAVRLIKFLLCCNFMSLVAEEFLQTNPPVPCDPEHFHGTHTPVLNGFIYIA